jgi:hypothetical protein
LGSRRLERRPKAEAGLRLEVTAGWVGPSSRGLWSGDARAALHRALLGTEAPRVGSGGNYRIRKWAPCSTSGPSDYGAEGSNRFNMAKSKLRQLVRFPWAADSCPWVGKLRTVLPLHNRVIRDSAVPLGLTHQRGANGVAGNRNPKGWEYDLRLQQCGDRGPADASVQQIRTAPHQRQVLHPKRPPLYSDEKVANREIRVWHFVIFENGY